MLNADAYIQFFKKLIGIRSVRHLFRKEVIIHDPDYQRLPGELQTLSDACRSYMEQKNLKGAPNYFKLWMTDAQDEAVENISNQMELLVEELSNTRSTNLLTLTNNLPIIPVRAHTRPFRTYWLNAVCGVIVPVGLFLYFRIWAFRIRLYKDLERIIKTCADLQLMMEKEKNK